MEVPARQSPVWKAVLTDQKRCTFTFLAANIYLYRAKAAVKQNPACLPKCEEELWSLLSKNASLPSVQQDIRQLM